MNGRTSIGNVLTFKRCYLYGWRCRGIFGLNPRLWIKVLRVRFPSMPGTFCPSARHFIHIAALHGPPRCINGYPVGCEHYFVAWCVMCASVKWRLDWMLPRELRRCTMSAGSIMNTVTGVIIHCKALWVVSHTRRRALYKINQVLLCLWW